MDIEKLRKTYVNLISFLQNKNAGRETISSTRSMCEHMIQHEGEYESYPEYYQKFIDPDGFHASNQRSRHLRTLWRSIWAFEEYDHLPDGKWFNPIGMSHLSMNKLNSNFRSFMEKEAIPAIENRQIKEQSVHNISCVLAKFLLCMQEQGATTLKKITEERIISFFYSNNEQIRSLQVGNIISMVLSRIDNPECKRINSLIPALKIRRMNYSPITDETVALVKQELEKKDESFSKRDRAIITIALYTGLRSSDIVNLTIDNIDWGRDLISIIQSKTQKHLVLPLRASVGNALFDYVLEEKKAIKRNRFLFHKDDDICRRMPYRRVGDIISNFFKRSKLLENGSARRIRAFRHHLASALLKNGTSIIVVRSILGHQTRKAINAYFDADVEDTRKCCLDISEFPINKRIFNF